MALKEDNKTAFLNDPIWAKVLSRYLKIERSKQNFTYQQLSDALASELGVHQNTGNLKTKFNRGNFGAQLFLMSLVVMGTKQVDVEQIRALYEQLADS